MERVKGDFLTWKELRVISLYERVKGDFLIWKELRVISLHGRS